MAHIIQPIVIGGVSKCISDGSTANGTWRTVETLTTPATVDVDDAWYLIPNAIYSTNEAGAVEFGVSCISTINFTVNFDEDETTLSALFYLNDVLQTTLNPTSKNPENEGATKTYEMTLTPRACGNIVKIVGDAPYGASSGEIFIRLEVTAVG
jgi:hypothetical protein